MNLFSEASLKGVTLKNRVVRSATWEGMCDKEGKPAKRLLGMYRALCKGGIGLIITGNAYVRADGKQMAGMMGADSDTLIPAMKDLTQAVHDEGTPIFCQLVHAGGQASAKTIKTQPLAPSAVKDATSPDLPRAMTHEDIQEIVAAFGDAAKRVKLAGFDGVQLHAAHGYLVNQFLSPLTNLRQDEYGGTLENRLRFLEEIYGAVRRTVGSSYPVAVKLTAADNIQGGFTLEEAITVAQKLEEWGIDAIEVSSGTAGAGEEGPVRRQIDSPKREAYNASYAGRIKEQVKVPVIVVGGFRSMDVCETHLAKGTADFIALSRPLVREPDLVRRWRADKTHRASCISCNGCFRPGLRENGIRCVLVGAEVDDETLLPGK